LDFARQRGNPQERPQASRKTKNQPASPHQKTKVALNQIQSRSVINLSGYHQHPSQQAEPEVVDSHDHFCRRRYGTSQVKENRVEILMPHRGQRLSCISNRFMATTQFVDQNIEEIPGQRLALD
jgi:hypothetical protein